MRNNWAIVIGINSYHYHPERELKYAVNDARKVADFLINRADFGVKNVVLCLGDHSNKSSETYPTCANLLRLLKRDLQPEYLGQVDCFWFYFSGHGVSYKGRDYLITSDCLEGEVERFGLPIDEVISALKLHKDADIVLVLDACRQVLSRRGSDSMVGEQTIASAKEYGVITIFSCDFGQYSYEVEALQQGAFTFALIEGLSQYTIPSQLEQYLRQSVPVLTLKYRGVQIEQTPRIRIEPASKSFQSLLPNAVTSRDLAFLQDQAKDMEIVGNFDIAAKLWWGLIEVSPHKEKIKEYKEAIARIEQKIRAHSGNNFSLKSSAISNTLLDEQKEKLDKASLLIPDTSSTPPKSSISQAIQDFTHAINLKPDFQAVYVARAAVYNNIGEYDSAIADLNQALRIFPGDLSAIAQRGKTYQALERPEDALPDLNWVLGKKPDSTSLLISRGNVFQQLEQYAALADFSRVLELEPGNQDALANRGEAYRRLGRYEEAIKDLSQVIEQNPEDYWSTGIRGMTYCQLGHPNRALEDYNQAIKLASEKDWWYYGRALAYQMLREPELAYSDLTTAIQIGQKQSKESPRVLRYSLNLALYYLANSEVKEAAKIYQEVLPKSSLTVRKEVTRELKELRMVMPDIIPLEFTRLEEIRNIGFH